MFKKLSPLSFRWESEAKTDQMTYPQWHTKLVAGQRRTEHQTHSPESRISSL